MALKEELTKNDFRFVEKLLYEYKTYESAIRVLEEELEEMLPSASSSIVKFDHNTKNTHGDSQPEKWTIKRNESLRAKWLRGRIREKKRHRDAIKEARRRLAEDESQLVWLKYDLKKPDRECWEAMFIGKTKFYELRNKVVYRIAEYIGLM